MAQSRRMGLAIRGLADCERDCLTAGVAIVVDSVRSAKLNSPDVVALRVAMTTRTRLSAMAMAVAQVRALRTP
ncbi:hypothetical protein O4H66_15135 [Comamonadaceae bacterium G21597-S1]|nr:hypothetical protein [Comamonadaceae bacterium G21597-S1]